jgi:hypothetical protein
MEIIEGEEELGEEEGVSHLTEEILVYHDQALVHRSIFHLLSRLDPHSTPTFPPLPRTPQIQKMMAHLNRCPQN